MRGLAFRLGDIPIRVDPSFWIIMGLFGLSRAVQRGAFDPVVLVEWVAMVFVGILLHELGHAVAFRTFGREPQVVLYGMGGLTSAAGRLTPGRRLVTTLAGPGIGILLGALAVVALQSGLLGLERLEGRSLGNLLRLSLSAPFQTDQLPELLFLDLLFINIGWGVLNLIPLYPLDGGQSLEALLELIGLRQAPAVTTVVSIAVAAAGGLWAVQNQQIYLLLIAVLLGMMNVRRLRTLRSPASVDDDRSPSGADAGLHRTLAMADQALQQGRPGDAVDMVEQEYRLRPGPASAQAYAAVLARTQRAAELEDLLGEEPERLGAGALAVIGAALVAAGRYPAALRAAEAGWNADPQDHWQHAVSAAAARAGMRDVDGAVRWLYTAADRGWDDRRRLEADPVFAEVRIDPRLPDIVARMGV